VEFGFHDSGGATSARIGLIGVNLIELLDHLLLLSAAQVGFKSDGEQAASAQAHGAGGSIRLLQEVAVERNCRLHGLILFYTICNTTWHTRAGLYGIGGHCAASIDDFGLTVAAL